MPLFFFDALFLVLTSSSSSCRYMLHLRFSQEGCFVAYQHTPQFTKRVACAYNRIQNTQVAALYDRLFFIIFFTHTTEILFMNSMFELSDECPLVCRSTLQCRLSDYVMFWTIPPLGR